MWIFWYGMRWVCLKTGFVPKCTSFGHHDIIMSTLPIFWWSTVGISVSDTLSWLHPNSGIWAWVQTRRYPKILHWKGEHVGKNMIMALWHFRWGTMMINIDKPLDRAPNFETLLVLFYLMISPWERLNIPSSKLTVCYWKWPSRNSGFTH